MAGTANEELLDALVRHQVYLLRLSGSLRSRINSLLNATEEDLARQIRDRLRNSRGGTTAGLKRVETLMKVIKNTRRRAWSEINEVWAEELVSIARQEPKTVGSMIAATAPVVVDTILPPARLLRSIALSRPFQGRTLREWASSVEQADIRRIHAEVQAGMIAGEPSDAIARRVVGTARRRGSDGATEITRRNAAAITRTAVNHVANHARRAFFEENKDIISEEQYVATLDGNTTPICRANDGKRFPIGEGPQPPLHFGCRSLRVAVLDGVALGDRPAKPTTERQLVREYASREGLGQVGSRADLPRGTKGSYDRWARGRIRELTGPVPGSTTYQTWLRRQPSTFQEDILGVDKARLFRRGGLTLDKFVDMKTGRSFTLQELSRRHTQAFRDAGLDRYVAVNPSIMTRADVGDFTARVAGQRVGFTAGHVRQSFTPVMADVRKLDRAWRVGDDWIGEGSQIGRRREQFRQWLGDNPDTPVRISEVGGLRRELVRDINGSPIKNRDGTYKTAKVPGFLDGRHRFSILRDEGVTKLPIAVADEFLEEFAELFGA